MYNSRIDRPSLRFETTKCLRHPFRCNPLPCLSSRGAPRRARCGTRGWSLPRVLFKTVGANHFRHQRHTDRISCRLPPRGSSRLIRRPISLPSRAQFELGICIVRSVRLVAPLSPLLWWTLILAPFLSLTLAPAHGPGHVLGRFELATGRAVSRVKTPVAQVHLIRVVGAHLTRVDCEQPLAD